MEIYIYLSISGSQKPSLSQRKIRLRVDQLQSFTFQQQIRCSGSGCEPQDARHLEPRTPDLRGSWGGGGSTVTWIGD